MLELENHETALVAFSAKNDAGKKSGPRLFKQLRLYPWGNIENNNKKE